MMLAALASIANLAVYVVEKSELNLYAAVICVFAAVIAEVAN